MSDGLLGLWYHPEPLASGIICFEPNAMISFLPRSAPGLAVTGGVLLSVLALAGCNRSKPQAKETEQETKVVPKPSTVARKKAARPLAVTVAGQALDEQGQPVEGATLILASGNPLTSFGQAVSDSGGRFQFAEVELAPLTMKSDDATGRYEATARYEVFGVALDKAYSTTGTKIYRVSSSGGKKESPGAETLPVQLVFRQPMRVWGRVLDESGQPIQNARLRMSLRLPVTPETRHFSPADAQRLTYYLFPGVIDTISDAEGRFELRAAPPDTPLGVSVTHNDYWRQNVDVSTAAEPPAADAKTKASPIEFVLKRTRRLVVKATSDTGEPMADLPVYAYAGKFANASTTGGRTDENGMVTLRLLPGKYYVRGRPKGDIESVDTSVEVTVGESLAEQTVELQMQQACRVVLKAVDVDTGVILRNVPFWMSDDGGGSFAMIMSPAAANGEVELKENPGKRLYGISARQAISNVFGEIVVPILDGYQAVNPAEVTEGRKVELLSGKTVEIEFKLRRAK